MRDKILRNFLLILFLGAILGFGNGCKVSDRPYRPNKYMEYSKRTNKVKAKRVNDIQYRSAYKYDTEGTKFKKHFKRRRQRKNDKKWFFGLF